MSTEKTYLTRCPDCKTVHEIRAITYEQSYPRFGAATCPKCKLRYSPKGSAGSYTPSEDAVGKIARARADIAAALEERRIVATLISLGWTPPGEKQTAQVEPIYIVGKGWQCDDMPPDGTKLYTEAPAVAVNEQMLKIAAKIYPQIAAVCNDQDLLDELKQAIAAAKAAKGGV